MIPRLEDICNLYFIFQQKDVYEWVLIYILKQGIIDIIELYNNIPNYHKLLPKWKNPKYCPLRLSNKKRTQAKKLVIQFSNIKRDEQVSFYIYMLNKLDREHIKYIFNCSHDSMLHKYNQDYSFLFIYQRHNDEFFVIQKERWERIREKLLKGEAINGCKYYDQ